MEEEFVLDLELTHLTTALAVYSVLEGLAGATLNFLWMNPMSVHYVGPGVMSSSGLFQRNTTYRL